MKYLLPLLTLSLLFSQELEVEGNLKVTGTVESATIDSMQQVIDGLQAQIDTMHADNMLETRVYELSNFSGESGYTQIIDLNELTGYEIEYANLEIIRVSNYQISDCATVNIQLQNNYIHYNGNEAWIGCDVILYNNGTIDYSNNNGGGLTNAVYDGNNLIRIVIGTCDNGYLTSADVTLSVTAQFTD